MASVFLTSRCFSTRKSLAPINRHIRGCPFNDCIDLALATRHMEKRVLMRSILCRVVLRIVSGGCVATPAPVHAFGFAGWGGKLGYVSPENLDARSRSCSLEFAQSGSRLHLLPSVMYWNTNGLSDFSANGDLYYHFAPEAW